MEGGGEATGALVHAGSDGDCTAIRVQGFSERPVKGQVGAVIVTVILFLYTCFSGCCKEVGVCCKELG
jgi:hypothetical protein